MRIRSIKPEFWRSKDVTSLAIPHRFLFIGLWSYVDDNGVGKDDMASVIGDLFAEDMLRDPRETVARVTEGLSLLSERGLIRRYSVGERAFLFITKWESHQRIDKPAKPRFPRPDGDLPVSESPFATSSRQSRDTPATGTGEQRNRGAEEQGSSNTAVAVTSDLTALFDAAYSRWPKKVDRKQAFERFKIAARKIDATLLAAYIERFGDAYAATTERQFTPALGVWLGRERWTDDLPTAGTGDRKPTRTERNLDFVAQLKAQQQQGPRLELGS